MLSERVMLVVDRLESVVEFVTVVVVVLKEVFRFWVFSVELIIGSISFSSGSELLLLLSLIISIIISDVELNLLTCNFLISVTDYQHNNQ